MLYPQHVLVALAGLTTLASAAPVNKGKSAKVLDAKHADSIEMVQNPGAYTDYCLAAHATWNHHHCFCHAGCALVCSKGDDFESIPTGSCQAADGMASAADCEPLTLAMLSDCMDTDPLPQGLANIAADANGQLEGECLGAFGTARGDGCFKYLTDKTPWASGNSHSYTSGPGDMDEASCFPRICNVQNKCSNVTAIKDDLVGELAITDQTCEVPANDGEDDIDDVVPDGTYFPIGHVPDGNYYAIEDSSTTAPTCIMDNLCAHNNTFNNPCAQYDAEDMIIKIDFTSASAAETVLVNTYNPETTLDTVMALFDVTDGTNSLGCFDGAGHSSSTPECKNEWQDALTPGYDYATFIRFRAYPGRKYEVGITGWGGCGPMCYSVTKETWPHFTHTGGGWNTDCSGTDLWPAAP